MRTSIPSELRALVSVLGVLTLSACTSAPTAVAPLPRKAAAVGSGSQAVQNKGRQDITSGITHWYASRDINVDGLRVRNSGTSLYIHGPGDVRVNGEVWVQDGGFLQLQEGVTMQIMNTKAGVNSHHVVTGGQLRVYGSSIGGKVDTSPPVSTGIRVSGVGSLFHSEYATVQASTGVSVDSGTIYADHLTQGTYPDALYVMGTGTLELKNSTMPLGVTMDAAAGAGITYRPDLRRAYPGWRSTVVSPSRRKRPPPSRLPTGSVVDSNAACRDGKQQTNGTKREWCPESLVDPDTLSVRGGQKPSPDRQHSSSQQQLQQRRNGATFERSDDVQRDGSNEPP